MGIPGLLRTPFADLVFGPWYDRAAVPALADWRFPCVRAWAAALVSRWKVPEDNVFVRPQGHFSASLGLMRDDTPLRRLASLLGST
jgi:hypothetical protein